MLYILAYPEVIKQIISIGALNESVADYLDLHGKLICSDVPEILISIGLSVKPEEQVYLVAISSTLELTNQLLNKPYIKIPAIDFTSVRYVAISPKANPKLLSRILKDVYEVQHKVEPKFFSIFRFAENNTAYHLMDDQSHMDFMKFAFLTAKESLLITSYTLNSETICHLIDSKSIFLTLSRNIRLYFYVNDKCELTDEVVCFFNQYNILIDNMYTHSKIIAIDHKIVAIGSFNWLGCFDNRYSGSANGTMALADDCCNDLVESIWEHIHFYRNIQFGNWRRVGFFSQDRKNFHCLDFRSNQIGFRIIYIPSPEAHQYYLKTAIERVYESIVVCSPYLHSDQLTNYFPMRFLYRLANNNIKLVFVVQEGQDVFQLSNMLDRVSHLRYSIIYQKLIHLKTIIIDDNEIACGSFNWLSASRDRLSDSHNHEVTLAVLGEGVKPLVAEFYNSPLGGLVKNELQNMPQRNYQTNLFSSTVVPEESVNMCSVL